MEQIMQMKDIYAAAHLVLIAASGNGADHGLRLRLSSPPELVHPQTSVGDVRLLLCHHLWDLADINKTPWAARPGRSKNASLRNADSSSTMAKPHIDATVALGPSGKPDGILNLIGKICE
jgi:hypothetical protein